MKTATDYLKAAREALDRDDLDQARQYREKAVELKAIEDAETSAVKAQRLPFPDAAVTAAEPASVEAAAEEVAIKSWYHNRHGDPDTALEMILTDLYGHDFKRAAWAKTRDFNRFMRTGQYDPRLKHLMVYSKAQVEDALLQGASVAELKSVQVESNDILGGYLVPEDFRDRVISRVMGMTVMRKITDPIRTTRDRVTTPVIAGGDSRFTSTMRAVWVDESPTSTQAQTTAEFANSIINVHTLMSHVAVSKNVLEDSQGATAISPIVERIFAETLALTEDEAFLVGNGVAKPLGILRDATTGGFNALSYGTPVTINSGEATRLKADAIKNTPLNIDQQYRAGGTWLMSKGSVRVIRTLKAGDGTYLWSDRNRQLQSGPDALLEGYPILESEVLAGPSTASGDAYTANVYPILFVCRGGYSIVDRVGMSVDRYDDSTTARQNQIVLVARHRVGGQVVDPWKIAGIKISA